MSTETTQAAPVQVAEPVQPTTAQEPSTAPEVKVEAPAVETPAAPVKTPEQKRIDKLTARNKDYERQLEAARSRIAEIETSIKSKDPEADKPKADDFNSPEEYADKLADWKLSQKEREKAEPKPPSTDEIRKQEREFAQKQMSFTQKENEFRSKEPKYDQSSAVVNQLMKLANPQDPSFAVFAQTIMDADDAPALIHYLGTNPQEALGLFGKSPAEVEDSLLVIIDKIGAPPTPPPQDGLEEDEPRVLPTPPTPITASSAKPKKTADQMTGKELLAKYMPSGR
jgi:hypothetical protein